MRKLFLIPLFFFACTESAQLGEAIIQLEGIPAGAKTEPYADNGNLVKVTIERAPGFPSEQGDYLEGKRHGTWTTYHPNDLVKSITSYVNGIKQGTHVQIDDRGRLLLKAYYHNNGYDGGYVAYKQTKVIERKYYSNGKLEGDVKKYYDNGAIMEESIYENGKLNGISKWYDQQGNVTLEYEYEDGQLIKK